jgi:hypothetical protein
MGLRLRIFCGLTFATAAPHLAAHEGVQPSDALSDPPPAHVAAPSATQPYNNDSSQPQSGSPTRQPTNPQDPTPTPPAQSVPETEEVGPQPPTSRPDRWHWLDWTRQGVYDALWHSAMRVDRWFGSPEDETEYQKVYGSIAPALLWDRHYGISEPFRFNVNLPLPQIDQRFHAFVGRFDPNELITESSEPSGAFRRQYGPATQDQTLFGLGFHQPPKQGGYFDAGAGVRIALPMDPYLKGSYVYDRGASDRGLFSVRETAFWQHSQGFGVTSRMDTERIYDLRWLTRLTGSVTLSEKSAGVLWWAAADLMRGFASRRAFAFEIESDGQTDAPVPLHTYGAKFAYRRSVLRKWLIMEWRTSISWPKDLPQQERKVSPGLGVGFEMLFGTDEFLARPVTF